MSDAPERRYERLNAPGPRTAEDHGPPAVVPWAAPARDPDAALYTVDAMQAAAVAGQQRTAAQCRQDLAAFFDDTEANQLADAVLALLPGVPGWVAGSPVEVQTIRTRLDALAACEVARVVASGIHGPHMVALMARASVRIRLETRERSVWDVARPLRPYPRRWQASTLEKVTRGAVDRAWAATQADVRRIA